MNIVLLNLYAGGHHGQHVGELARYWASVRPDGHLHMVGSEAFAAAHADVVALLQATPTTTFHTVEPFTLPRTLMGWDRRHGIEAARWAARLGADHLIFLYLDHAQLSLATTLRGGTTRYSGLHFRPSFHYGEIGSPAGSWRERVSRWRKKMVLRGVLLNPQVHTLFELDPYAVLPLQRLGRPDAVVALPEPFTPPAISSPPSLLARVEPGRRVASFFGVLDARKGLGVVLEALALLPEAAQQRLALVLAGRMHEGERAAYLEQIERIRKQTAVQILLDERFLAEGEIQPLLEASDLVLMPYLFHVGSSGVLVRAAHAGRPVLTSDYGVTGAHTRRHRLGLAVDTSRPGAVADALAQCLQFPDSIPFDPAAAAAFAAANTSEAFAATFFARFLPARAR